MKNLLIVIKISLLLLPLIAFANRPVGTVQSVSGNVFSVYDGVTRKLVPGSSIMADSYVITEIGAKLSYIDYYDRQFDFAGGSHIKVLENQIEMSRGYVWIESFQNKQSFQLRSANSKVNLSNGEIIFSFDSLSGRSQLLCVDGNVTLSNKIDPDFYASLSTGEFSFIDPDINEGLPRGATKIGYQSYEKLASLFDKEKVQPQANKKMIAKTTDPSESFNYSSSSDFTKSLMKSDEDEVGSRAPASVPIDQNIGESDTNVDAISSNLLKVYKPQTTKTAKAQSNLEVKKRTAKSSVKVRTFGTTDPGARLAKKVKPGMTIGEMLDAKGKRSPASTQSIYQRAYKTKENTKFINSLKSHYRNQQKHPDEVNSLIRELKNYDRDYSQDY